MYILEFSRRKLLSIWAKQGDTGRELEFQCINNSIPMDLTGCTVILNMKRPVVVFANAEITEPLEGKIKINLTSDMLSQKGKFQADVSIFDANGKVESSTNFELDVEGSQRDEEAIEGSNDFSALLGAMGRVSTVESQLAQISNPIAGSIPPRDLQSQILWRNKSTLLHDFQTSVIVNHGIVEYDTNKKYSGTRSLKITTSATTKYSIARIDFGAATLDVSTNYLMLMAMRDLSSAELASIRLQLWGEGYANLGVFHSTYGGALKLSKGKWQLITFSDGSNTPITEKVRYIDINVGVAGDVQGIVYLNQLRAVPKPEQGYVTITLDGAYPEQYTQLKPLLDAKGYRACLMISEPSYIDNSSAGYMTLEQIKDCEASGWDISIHSGGSNGTVNLLSAEQLKEIAVSKKKWLKDKGFNINRGGRFICALQNLWGELAVDTMREYFHFIRTGYGLILQSAIQNTCLPIFNPHSIPDIASIATYTQQSALIQAAGTHKQWAVLCWHQPGRSGELTLAEMQNMLNLIESNGMKVVTFSDIADDILRLK